MINRKILISAISIVSALAITGGATFATFTSQASSLGNTFSAGSLTLVVTPQGGAPSSASFSVTGAVPGQVFDKSITLSNTGSVPASSVVLKDITGISGILPPVLLLEIYDDVDSSGTVNVGDTLQGSAPVNSGAWVNIPLGFAIPASGTHAIVVRVTFDSAADNGYQNGAGGFDLNFQANQ